MAGSTFTLAWRNLWRNKRRTILALAAIGLSQALVLFYNGIVRGYGDWMVDAITGPMLGHVQVHAPGWRKDRAIDRTVPVGPTLAAVRGAPGVESAHARIYAPALAALGQEGFAAMIVGLQPEAEARVHGLLAGTPVGRLSGHDVFVGQGLAAAMGIVPGAEIALVGQAADGSLANDLFRVAGTVNTPVDLVNRMGILMPLETAQALLAMPGQAHELTVRALRPERAAELAAELGALPALAGLEVLDWQRVSPELLELVKLVRASWIFILLLVFVAAAAGVANTMLMATFERIHELGMLLALGASPMRLVRLIVVEALALGLVGVLVGSAVGGAIVAATHRSGVDFTALAGGPSELAFAGMQFSMTFYPTLAVADVVQSVTGVAVVSLLAALWPAVRVARLQPTAALRA